MKRKIIVILLIFILVVPIIFESIYQKNGTIDQPVIDSEQIIDNTNSEKNAMDDDINHKLPSDIKDQKLEPVNKNEIMYNLNQFNGYFTENRGQVGNDSVRYYIQGGGVWFLDDGVVFELREEISSNSPQSTVYSPESRLMTDDWRLMTENRVPEPVEYRGVVIKLEFVGASDIRPVGKERLSWNNNYFYGNDSSKWCTDVPNFGEVWYENIYDNIDLKYYTTEKGLKYDFIVHLGGDPNKIILQYKGINKLKKDINNNLIIKTIAGNLLDSNLFIYQYDNNNKNEIYGKFKLINGNTYGYEIVEEYDKQIDLIIDPIIFSTYIGMNESDSLYSMTIDLENNIYLTGYTLSPDFPTTVGAYDTTYNINCSPLSSTFGMDVFVLKMNSDGSSLIYSTFIGGNISERGTNIFIDKLGNAYVVGYTKSWNFPVTPGAFNTTHNPGKFYNNYNDDGFVLKLNPNGSSLIYSTFVGGKGTDNIRGLAVDNKGCAYITGGSGSSDFPTTPGSYNPTYKWSSHTFVTKFNSNGSSLIYSTFINGIEDEFGQDICIDSEGNAYVVGIVDNVDFPTTPGAFDRTFNGGLTDGFLFKLNKKGTKLIYSTYFGGKDHETCSDLALDSKCNPIIIGITRSTNFPITTGAYDATFNGGSDIFVIKFNSNASTLLYSTFIGGNDSEGGGCSLKDDNDLYISGGTSSMDFPVTKNALNITHNGKSDVFILELNLSTSSIIYSTFLGGNSSDRCSDIERDLKGNIYLAGSTWSSDFPTTKGAYDNSYNGINGSNDIFVLKFGMNKTNSPPIINSFKATKTPEGSKVIFTVNASDPDNDTLVYSYDLDNDGDCDVATYNCTITSIWPDDYTGNATVHLSDGTTIVNATTEVVVYNVAPTVKLSTRQNGSGSGNVSATMSVRIAGEKWHDVRVELYKDNVMVINDTLIRYPGNPNNQMLHFKNHTLNSSANCTAILRYTPDNDPVNGQPNGATPCWVILNLSNRSRIKLHHTFKVKHNKTHVWVVNLNPYLTINKTNNSSGGNVTFTAVVFDPGADDLTFYWDFGDGTNLTTCYPNKNKTYPVNITDIVKHFYTAPGSYIVKLIVKDDDGGEVIIKYTF